MYFAVNVAWMRQTGCLINRHKQVFCGTKVKAMVLNKEADSPRSAVAPTAAELLLKPEHSPSYHSNSDHTTWRILSSNSNTYTQMVRRRRWTHGAQCTQTFLRFPFLPTSLSTGSLDLLFCRWYASICFSFQSEHCVYMKSNPPVTWAIYHENRWKAEMSCVCH